MLKKFVLGLVFAVSGLLVWSCGDGSVDPLNDTELLVISRFPSTIDYDLLDSVVNACKKDKECWEKAKKTGEIYKGDYTQILRDDSGNIIIQEGDSAFVWKDGKKLPVFEFSSNSEEDDDDGGSNGSEVTSGSSRIRSSGAGYDEDEYIDDDGPNGGGSGSGTGEVNHNRSSNSNSGSGNSSSIDLSFLSSSSKVKVLSSSTVVRSSSSSKKNTTSSSSRNFNFLSSSSSSLGVASSSSIDNGDESSSSKIVIDQSSVSQSSSSVSEYVLSSSSTGTHGGGGGTEATCGAGTVSGTCVASPSPGFRNEVVTYTFTPDAKHTCAAFDEVKWYVNEYLEEGAYHPTTGEPLAYWADPSSSSRASFSFDVKYSSIGDKKSVIFSMGGQNKQCDAVTVKRRCESNTYTCSRILNSATNNLWKNGYPSGNGSVSYTWSLVEGSGNCLDISSVTWGGAASGGNLSNNGRSITKVFTEAIDASVSLTVEDELGSHPVTGCGNAVAVNVPDVVPTFSVSNMTLPTNYTVKVTPTSVAGCSYDVGNKCSYSLEDENGTVVASSTGGYTSGALNSFSGATDEETVNYTLTLTNYIGSSEPKEFSITYVTPTPKDASTASTSYARANAYSVSTASSISENKFKCVTSSAPSGGLVIGYFNGTEYKAYPGQWGSNNGYVVSASSTYTFVIFNDAPTDIQCYLSW